MASSKDTKRLSPKRKKFAELYIKYWNGAKAATEAGYSKRSASSIAYTLLRNDEVRAYIHERMRAQDGIIVAQADEVLAFLTAVMRGEVSDQFGLDAQLADRIKAGTELLKRYCDIEDGKEDNSVTVEFVGEGGTAQ